MNRSVTRFLLWLASSDARRTDVPAIREFLMHTDPDAIDYWVERVRRAIPADAFASAALFRDDRSSDTASEVERILRDEMQLSAMGASKVLYSALRAEWPEASVPKFREREGLRRYVGRLLQRFNERELLSLAHRIQNDVQGTTRRTDWPLRINGRDGDNS